MLVARNPFSSLSAAANRVLPWLSFYSSIWRKQPAAVVVFSVAGDNDEDHTCPQAEPACFLLTLAAFVIVLRAGPQVSGRLAGAAGILLGLATATQTWPVVFGPTLLLALPSSRRRAQFAAGVAGVVALASCAYRDHLATLLASA